MSRSASVWILFLVPMIGQAAVVQHSSALKTDEEAACRGTLNANTSHWHGVMRSSVSLRRMHHVDTGGMLAMGYSYYGAQRPNHTVAAREVLGLNVANGGRRNVLPAGGNYRGRHQGIRPARCIARTRKGSP